MGKIFGKKLRTVLKFRENLTIVGTNFSSIGSKGPSLFCCLFVCLHEHIILDTFCTHFCTKTPTGICVLWNKCDTHASWMIHKEQLNIKVSQDTLSTLLLLTQVYKWIPDRMRKLYVAWLGTCAPYEVAPCHNAPQGDEKVHYTCRIDIESSDRGNNTL